MSDTIEGMRRVYEEALALAERKNHDYGDAWRANGWRGNLSRVFEKTHRLRTLLWNGGGLAAQVADEDVRQTAIDMLNTLTFFVMNLEQGVEWGHEMPYHNVRVVADWDPEQIVHAVPEDLDRIHQGIIPDNGPPTDALPVRDPGATMNDDQSDLPEKPSPRRRTASSQ